MCAANICAYMKRWILAIAGATLLLYILNP